MLRSWRAACLNKLRDVQQKWIPACAGMTVNEQFRGDTSAREGIRENLRLKPMHLRGEDKKTPFFLT